MSLENWSGHLCMLVIVVLDEGLVGHARFLFDEYGGFDDLTKAGSIRIAGFQNHVCAVVMDKQDEVVVKKVGGPNFHCPHTTSHQYLSQYVSEIEYDLQRDSINGE
jgi:hypothetical protein